MATTPRSNDTNAAASSTAPSVPAGEVSATTPPPAGPNTPPTHRSRWVLASIASVGLLTLGLLGGMLIGQHMVPPGMHGAGIAQGNSSQQEGYDQFPRVPDQMKERIKDRLKDHMQERRDGQIGPQGPRGAEPSPTSPTPNGGAFNDSLPAPTDQSPAEPIPNNG